MKMKIFWERTFDSAHRIFRLNSNCRFLHGHTYRVKAEVEGELNSQGMVVDFGLLKEKIIELFDHKVILEMSDPLLPKLKEAKEKIVAISSPPTAENLSILIAKIILSSGENLTKVKVEVYETPLQKGIIEIKREELKNISIHFEELNKDIL